MIRVIGCGKIKEKWLKQGIEEYTKRISGFEKIEIIEVEDEKTLQSNSEADNKKVLDIEAERMLKKINNQDYVIVLDLAGKPLDSLELARHMDKVKTYGKSHIDFVIGGSLGLGQKIIDRADYRWKLSENTFPHQLCRLILVEQIYRALTIQNNTPYHK